MPIAPQMRICCRLFGAPPARCVSRADLARCRHDIGSRYGEACERHSCRLCYRHPPPPNEFIYSLNGAGRFVKSVRLPPVAVARFTSRL